MRLLVDGQTLATPEIERGIGVVFKRLCEQLIPSAAGIEWYVAVRAEEDLRHFSTQVRALVKPVLMGRALQQQGLEQQTAAYTEILHQAARRHGLDAYWTPNPLMHHVLLPTDLHGLVVFATIYDLIPLVLRAECLDAWPEVLRAEYLRRVQRLPGWADRLVFISEHSRRDYERVDSRVAARAEVVPLAVDHARFWPHVAPRPHRELYVLYIGGFECPRKNMDRALEAFALLVRGGGEFQQLKFRVVCGYTPQQKGAYLRRAERLGVGGQVDLTGYVDDDTLAELYRQAAVFFFPSVYEGFGLPVLEAMACGLPVVATRVSSIPEVAGEVAYYCSPTDPHDMARALAQALRERGGPNCRRTAAIARAAQFRWEHGAARYAHLFTDTVRSSLCAATPLRAASGPHAFGERAVAASLTRPRVAHVMAALPSPYGLHGQSMQLLGCMQQHAELTVYAPGADGVAAGPTGVQIRPLWQLPADIVQLDAVVYHIGSGGKHDEPLCALAAEHPGIVVLTELALGGELAPPRLAGNVAAGASFGLQQQHVAESCLARAAGRHGGLTTWELAWALAGHSRATIVPSRWAREQMPGIERVFVVPHWELGCPPPAASAENELRRRLGLREDAFVLGAFGQFTGTRLELLVRLVERLSRDGFPVQLLLECDSEHLPPSARAGTAGNHDPACASWACGNVIPTGPLEGEQLLAAIDLCDVVLHVRCPSAGAAPRALAAAFHLAKACLVSDERQYAELPHAACWKVERNVHELAQLVACVEALLQDPAARKQLGHNARFFAQTYGRSDAAANLYLDVVRRVVAAGRKSQAA